MGDLSANMKAALGSRSARVGCWLFEAQWPDGTIRYSAEGPSSRTRGHYQRRVSRFGAFRQAAGGDNAASVQDVTFEVELADNDGLIQQRLGYAQAAYNTVGTLYLAGGDEALPNVSDWYTAVTGYLDSIGGPGRGYRTLKFRGLNVFAQAIRSRTIDLIEFPNADPAAVGTTIPRAWGRLQGVGYPGTKNGGACPTYLVDTVGFQYLAVEGWVDIPCVYEDGVAIDFQSTSGAARFTVVHSLIGATQYTLIKFTSTQGTKVVTCDIYGRDTNGDGTGTLIESPVLLIDDILKATLSPTGASIVDITNAASVPPQRHHTYAGYWLGGQAKTGVQLVSDLARSFALAPYLKGNGLVAFGSELSWDGEATDPTSAPTVRAIHDMAGGQDTQPDHGGQDMQQDAPGIDIAAKESLTYATRATAGSLVVVSGDALSRSGIVAVDAVQAPFLDVLAEQAPDQILPANLRSWFEAASLTEIEHGESIATGGAKSSYTTLNDLSNNSRVWQAQGATAPLLSRGEACGLPAIALNTPLLTSNAFGTVLVSTTGFTFFLVAKLRSVSAAGTDGTTTNDTIIDFNGSDAIQVTASTLNANLSLRGTDGSGHFCTFPYAALLAGYAVICCHFTGANLYLGVNETRLSKMGTVACGTIVGLTANAVIIGARNALTSPSSVNIAAGAFWNAAMKENERLSILQYLTARYVKYPTAGIGRATATLRQLGHRNLRNSVTVDLDLAQLDVPLMGQMNVQDPDVPNGFTGPAFPGVAGDQPWQKRPHLQVQRTIDPQAGKVSAVLLDAQEPQVCLWISARADESQSGADVDRYPGLAVYPNVQLEPLWNDGAPAAATYPLECSWSDQYAVVVRPGRLMLGGPFTVPQGGVSSLVATPIYIPGGIWIQSARTNILTRSSFVSGVTGLTLVGGGVAVDTADLFFPSTFTPNSLKLTVTGGLDQTVAWAGPGTATNVPLYFSMDFKCDSGKYLMLRLNSTTPNLDYDPATGLYNHAAPFFFQCDAWAGHAASKRRGRFIARLPGVGAGVGSLNVTAKLLGSHGNGAAAHIYHAQVQPCGDSGALSAAGFGSRLVSDAGGGSSFGNGAFRVYNGITAADQVWPVSRGSCFVTLVLGWNAADIIGDHAIFDVPYDGQTGNNYFRGVFEYNAGSPRLAFRVKGAGSEVVSAVSLAGYQIGDIVRIGFRWTSAAAGELGLAGNTCSTFIKKLGSYDRFGNIVGSPGATTKGNDIVCTKPTAAVSALHVGSMLSTSNATVKLMDSVLQDFLVVPRCAPDAEFDKRA